MAPERDVEGHTSHAENGWRATIEYRVTQTERMVEKHEEESTARIDKIDGKMNTLLISVIGLALSIAGSAVIFALTISFARGR